MIEDFFSSTGKLCGEKVRKQNKMGQKGRKSRIKVDCSNRKGLQAPWGPAKVIRMPKSF